jgi:hypothetical protein
MIQSLPAAHLRALPAQSGHPVAVSIAVSSERLGGGPATTTTHTRQRTFGPLPENTVCSLSPSFALHSPAR